VKKKTHEKAPGFQRRGTLFVISAPSGAGKTTLCQKLLNNVPGLKLSVSYTTRPPRQGEVNNVDYTFISESKFKKMIERGEFAEWAVVHGNLYGTSLKRLKKLTREGYDIILDIDTHGAVQLKNRYENAVYIFIFPPSLNVLKERLRKRGTDSKETITRRLNNAKAEMANYKNYDYIIINDELEKAYHDLESIIYATRLRTENINDRWIKKMIK
jgi:guanylate kinase